MGNGPSIEVKGAKITPESSESLKMRLPEMGRSCEGAVRGELTSHPDGVISKATVFGVTGAGIALPPLLPIAGTVNFSLNRSHRNKAEEVCGKPGESRVIDRLDGEVQGFTKSAPEYGMAKVIVTVRSFHVEGQNEAVDGIQGPAPYEGRANPRKVELSLPVDQAEKIKAGDTVTVSLVGGHEVTRPERRNGISGFFGKLKRAVADVIRPW